MPDPHALAAFVAAILAVLVFPGPAVIYIVTQSMDQGRSAGLASVAGVATGSLVHVAAATIGVSALLARSAAAYSVLRWAGAAYLVGLGVHRLLGRSAREPDGVRAAEPSSLGRLFRRGVVVNILNPKTALFFLAFLPQFADPDRGPVALQLALLGTLFAGLGLLSDGTYAVAAARVGRAVRARRGSLARAGRWWAGGTYIGLGVATALGGHRQHG